MKKGFGAGSVLVLFLLFLFIFIAVTVLPIIGGYIGLGVKTVSAPNFERNYEWFKSQETAIRQLDNQVCQAKEELNIFKQNYGSPANFTTNLQDQYNDMTYIKNGYISKYNALVAEYNARRASFIKSFGRDPQIPFDYEPFYEAQCV